MPPAAGFGLGPDARITSRSDFKKAFAQGRKTVGRSLILWASRRPGSADSSRLGLSISAKAGGAVRRNRLKRLAREAFRLDRPGLHPGWDLVVYLRPGCRWEGLANARGDMRAVWRQAGVLPS